MDSFPIHITHNAKIICHTYEAGLTLTVDFNEATGMNPDQLCSECYQRHRRICIMIGAVPNQSRQPIISTHDKKMILKKIYKESIYE